MVIKYRVLFYIFSGILVVASIASLAIFGITLGRDFTGGALWEIRYEKDRPPAEELEPVFSKHRIEKVLIQPTDADGYIIRLPDITEEQHRELAAALSEEREDLEELRFDSVGPVVGAELTRKALLALAVAIAAIILYIAWAFRHVSYPISSWFYGIIAIVALVHDIIIPAGIFAYLGIEIDMLFLSALLTILGFSVHDTIVVFDRVRENLRKGGSHEPFAELVNRSVKETFVRSLNTSLAVAIVLAAVLFFGGDSTFHFILALLIGIIAGTYSSLFVASPLLVTIERRKRKM